MRDTISVRRVISIASSRVRGRVELPRVHMLHIGKTGGNAIKAALAPVLTAGNYEVVFHDHDTTLADVPVGERVFFVLRDPVDRFVSGFYSRQRRGPQGRNPWTEGEERAFQAFSTPDELALALSSSDPAHRESAVHAMGTIGHVRRSYQSWLGDPEHLVSREPDILAVLSLPTLDSSFPLLCERLGLTPRSLPADDAAAYRAPASDDRRLSVGSVNNLKRWYASDYELIRQCESLAAFIGGA